jgi:maltooligosyltrehalose trehalohydrolase
LTTRSDWPLGAAWADQGRCSFLVWAPRAKKVEVHIIGPQEHILPMEPLERGYFFTLIEDIAPGALYRYRLDGQKERPDPASRYQPEGVHGPSQVVDPRFDWGDAAWRGIPLSSFVLYELHVGTFTPEGTFEAIVRRIGELKALGITAIEIMPVAQFAGNRNWGYDGAYPFAVQGSYGGHGGLKRLVNACHLQGMAVVLDVVYNHFGPEGNYSADFGPYSTDFYQTPWGAAINFEQAQSDEVRRYFIDNALEWITDFHIDALRLDAIHAIVDPSARTFVEELAAACHNRARELDRQVHLIAESNQNDRRVVNRSELGGWEFDAQWNDDFHHSLRVAITGERDGYFQDFTGVEHLARAIRDGFVFTGEYSNYRQKHYGTSSRELPGETLVVFAQNHDQVGNRRLGDRLGQVVCFEQAKLAAGTVLFSACVPLLFMGEEYAEPAPFLYFVSHGDPSLIEAVRRGRREEFASFEWEGELPDPQEEKTFLSSKLHWELKAEGRHGVLWNFYHGLLKLRRDVPALARLDKVAQKVATFTEQKVIFLRRGEGQGQVFIVYHFDRATAELVLPVPRGRWRKMLDSAAQQWGGPGSHAPDILDSDGEVQLTLSPWALLAFTAGDEIAR